MLRPSDIPQTNSSTTDYPYGRLRDDQVAGDKTGTPVRADWLQNIYYAILSVLNKAGVTPNGVPETALASQFADAVRNASNLSAGTLPDARLSTLFTRSLNNSVTQAGWFNIVKMEPYSSAIISVKSTGGTGESSLILSVSSSSADPGFAPTVTVLASGGRNGAANRISHVGSRATNNVNYWVYIYLAGATSRVVDVEIIQSTRFRPTIQTIATPEFPNLTDITNRVEVRYNEGIDAARIGGQLASNIPKLDQANTFAPGVVQTTGQQTIDIGSNFSTATKGVKIDGYAVGQNDDGKPSLVLICRKYAGVELGFNGFNGEITQNRGGAGGGIGHISRTARLSCTVGATTNILSFTGINTASVTLVETTHNAEQWYAVHFSAAAFARITMSGLFIGPLPIFIPDASGYPTTPVSTASLQALRGKFNAADLAEGTLADARLSSNVPKLKSGDGLNVNTMYATEQVIVQCFNGMGGTFPSGYTIASGDLIRQYVWDTNSKFQVLHSDARSDWLWHRQSANSSTWEGWAFIGSSLSYSINSNFTVSMLAVGQNVTISNYSGSAITITCSNGNVFQIVGSTNAWVGNGASFSLASGGSLSIKRQD
jgi:hypothetical protein